MGDLLGKNGEANLMFATPPSSSAHAVRPGACAFFLRFWMQWARVPFHNPFAQFIVRVTDFAVQAAAPGVPGLFGLDWASLLPFFIAELLMVLACTGSWAIRSPSPAARASRFPAAALASALRLMLYSLIGFVVLQAILSWVNPFSPLAPVFYALARPVLAPFQKIVPPLGGIDSVAAGGTDRGPIAAGCADGRAGALCARTGLGERWLKPVAGGAN
jgi:YggT family protein